MCGKEKGSSFALPKSESENPKIREGVGAGEVENKGVVPPGGEIGLRGIL